MNTDMVCALGMVCLAGVIWTAALLVAARDAWERWWRGRLG